MMTENIALELITRYIDDLHSGKTPPGLPELDAFPENMRPLVKSLICLGDSIVETNRFGEQLAKGNLDTDVPGAGNLLSVPMKEFHARLTGLNWNIGQLPRDSLSQKISLLDKVYGGGTTLASAITLEEQNRGDAAQQWSKAVNGWRYHEIVSAMNQLHIMMLEVDGDGNVLYANPPFKSMFFDLDKISYAGSGEQDVSALMTYLGTFSQYRELLGPDVAETDRFPVLRELFDPKTDAWYKVTTDRIKLIGGAYGLLHMIDDISEWKKHEVQLRESASIDSLTGAYTRSAGLLSLNEVFEERAVVGTCVAFADIDGLKAINDTFGHTEGDFTIRTIADIFMSCVRKSDRVIRYGGDEFVVIFRDCTFDSANAAIARMYEKLEEANHTLGKPYRLSFSIGCSPVEKHHKSVEELLSIVDELMYEKKRRAKPSVL